MGRLVETCPSCGEYNKADVPLYVWAIGGLMVLALTLGLGDPAAVVQVVGDFLNRLHGAPAP